MRRVAAVITIMAALALVAGTHAQAPTPTAEPELAMFPYRIVISAPEQIPAGQPVTFDMRYARISSATDTGNEIVLVHEGADFVSVAGRQGDAPHDLGPQNPGAERIALVSDAGEFDVTVRPHAGVTGALRLSFSVPGTGIALPEGTIDHATTEIVAPDDAVVTVFNDLDGDGVRDEGEPGLAGWGIDQGCGDAFQLLKTDDNGVIIAPVSEYGECFCLDTRPFGWLPTTVLTAHVTRAAAATPVFGLHDYGNAVMELHGETMYRGLPLVEPDPGITAPFAACAHSFIEFAAPSETRAGVIVESAATRAGCPTAGDQITPGLGGPGAAGPSLAFAPGTSAEITWVDGGDSMRFYASDITDAWVLDVASGRLTKNCAVIVSVSGGLTPPGFVRVFVLSDEVRPGCGAPGRMVRVVRGETLLDPILAWQPGALAQSPSFTVLVPHVTPPNAGDGATAARADRESLALAVAIAALASVALGAGFALRRRR